MRLKRTRDYTLIYLTYCKAVSNVRILSTNYFYLLSWGIGIVIVCFSVLDSTILELNSSIIWDKNFYFYFLFFEFMFPSSSNADLFWRVGAFIGECFWGFDGLSDGERDIVAIGDYVLLGITRIFLLFII